jgi:uncharacterized delta-60 repeat protein
MKSTKTILLLFGLSIFSIPSFSQAGILDSSFHKDGAAFFHFVGGSAAAAAIAVLPNEKILVAGTAVTGPGADSDILLLRFNTDGSLDPSFGNNGTTEFSWGGQDDFAKTMVVHPDGKILVAGWTVSNGKAHGILCRFSEQGNLDKTFDEDGVVYNGKELTGEHLMDLLLTDEAKILWCMFTKETDSSVTRILPNGEIDKSFGIDGEVIQKFNGILVFSGIWALLPDEKIITIFQYAFGDELAVSTVFFRFDKEGKNREVWAKISPWPGTLYDAIGAEEGVFTAGSQVSKFTHDGIFDESFTANGRQLIITPGYHTSAKSMVVQSDGKLVVVGEDGSNPDNKSFIFRLKEDGYKDKSFGTSGQTLLNFSSKADIAYATAIDADDRILVAGRSGDSLVVARVFGRKYTGPPNSGVDSIFFCFRPNPVGNVLTADYGLPSDGNISLELLDLFGRQVQSFYFEANRQAGHYIEPLPILDALSNGTYLLRVRSGKFHAVQKLVVIR